MASVGGLQDFRESGPPADIGIFQLACGVFVFQYTFSGTTYTCAVRSGKRGWILVDYGTAVPGRIINSALTDADATGYGLVTVAGATYALELQILFPAANLTLQGMGRDTFLDGDALTTGNHCIRIWGYADCVVRDLALQTEDGGGKVCNCVYIGSGSHRFIVENVKILGSDYDGISIGGGTVTHGLITGCYISNCDFDGIKCGMIAANFCDYLIISLNVITNNDDGIEINVGVRYCLIKLNQIHDNTVYGIAIRDATSIENVIENNKYADNGTANIYDVGTDTFFNELSETVVEPNGNIGLHPAIVLTDGISSVDGTIEFITPNNFQELVSAGVVVVPGGTGNLRRWVISEYGRRCHDEAYNLHEGSVAVATIAVTLNELECIDVSDALASLGKYDVVALTFGRAGADALDTVNADCYLLGFYMEYV